MFKQRDALLRLLGDDDPFTVNLVKEQLLEKGPSAIGNLTDLLNCDCEVVTAHVREVIAVIDSRAAVVELRAMCDDFLRLGELEKANWALARALAPGVDIPSCVRQLDHWGKRLADIVAGVGLARERVRLLAEFLGQGLNLHGNSMDYYDPNNSLLPNVIETRLGIPISLGIVYMLVAKRAKLDVEGINFPGHFIVRHEGVMFDPFERGRILAMSDCEAILARQKISARPIHFQRATSSTIFKRVLANLLYIYRANKKDDLSAKLADWMRRMNGGNR